MKIGVWKIAMANPSDVSELAALIASQSIKPQEIVAVIGKTEGNGGANDFTRGFATLSFQLLLSKHLGLTPDEVGKRIAFVWSGGTEGVLCPHATIFTRSDEGGADGTLRLTMGMAVSRKILPEEVGTVAQVHEVASTVRKALKEAAIERPEDVHYVQVKGPLLTPASIADADARGARLQDTRSQWFQAACPRCHGAGRGPCPWRGAAGTDHAGHHCPRHVAVLLRHLHLGRW